MEGALGALGWVCSCQRGVFSLHQDDSTGTPCWSRIKIERLLYGASCCCLCQCNNTSLVVSWAQCSVVRGVGVYDVFINNSLLVAYMKIIVFRFFFIFNISTSKLL